MLTFKLKPRFKPRADGRQQAQALKQHGSYLSSFKKSLFNHVAMQDGRFIPGYNRRKHSHSHYLIIDHQLRQYSKTFGHVGQNKIKFCIGLSLSQAYASKADLNFAASGGLTKPRQLWGKPGFENPALSTHAGLQMLRSRTALSQLMNIIETQSHVLLLRNQCSLSLHHGSQILNHHRKPCASLGTVLGFGYGQGLISACTLRGFDNEAYGWVGMGDTYRCSGAGNV